MAGIDTKNKVLDSHVYVSGEKKKGEYSICKSIAGGHVTGKWQNKDPRYAGNKIFAGYGMLLLLLILYFHGISILENNVVFAQTSPTTSNLLTDRSPSFLEAYWIDDSESTSSSLTPSNNNNNSIKKEVGPGEGASTLAVVLVNKGRSEITALTGYLTLPSSGFRSIQGENLVNSSNIAVASHDSIVKPGETFTLYFTINVQNNAEVGAYSGLLKLVYSKVLEVGQISASMAVPFRITGKVILDAASNTQNLVAGSSNPLRILIKNEGSADASGVMATVTDVTDGTATTTPTVSNNKNNNNNDDSNGGSIRDNSDSDNNVTSSSSTDEAATTENGQKAGSDASIISLQATTFNVGNIPAGGVAFITPTVYPSYSSGGTVQNLNLEISYNDAYGTMITTDKSIGIVISPNPTESVLSISPMNVINTSNLGNASANSVNGEDNTDRQEEDTILLTAGRIEEVKFSVSNNGDTPLKDVVLSLDSSLDSVKILGDSRWTFISMNASSKQELSTQVFAAENVIATPIEFTVDAEYISGGQSKTDSLSIGAYVDGIIKIKAYDFALNDIGGTPNLVGNLLNQGNTIALFTTVEMVNMRQVNTLASSPSTTVEQPTRPLVRNFPPQQYLGDLSENSPLPFSIPLNIDKDTPRGLYPISIRVTYTDNLRNIHELILNGTVDYTPKSTVSTTELGGIFGSGELSFFIMLVVIILAIISILAIIVIRKRKNEKRNSFNRNNEDVELFDDKPFSADNKKASGMKQ
jgi:hypothetical protein